MRRTILALLSLTTVSLLAMALWWSTDATSPEPVEIRPAAQSRPASTSDEPVHDCRTVGGREVCDTFGERDEGPGTYDDGDEGPGTGAAPAPRTAPAPTPRGEPVHDCRPVGGREVCDTFGERDEGPGTYDDSDEGPGTR